MAGNICLALTDGVGNTAASTFTATYHHSRSARVSLAPSGSQPPGGGGGGGRPAGGCGR